MVDEFRNCKHSNLGKGLQSLCLHVDFLCGFLGFFGFCGFFAKKNPQNPRNLHSDRSRKVILLPKIKQ
jgi:hypothetical protein